MRWQRLNFFRIRSFRGCREVPLEEMGGGRWEFEGWGVDLPSWHWWNLSWSYNHAWEVLPTRHTFARAHAVSYGLFLVGGCNPQFHTSACVLVLFFEMLQTIHHHVRLPDDKARKPLKLYHDAAAALCFFSIQHSLQIKLCRGLSVSAGLVPIMTWEQK